MRLSSHCPSVQGCASQLNTHYAKSRDLHAVQVGDTVYQLGFFGCKHQKVTPVDIKQKGK